jgi:DNA-binding IclR family transcriptional regulator
MPLSTTGIGKALILDREADWERIFEAEHPALPGGEKPDPGDFLKRMRDYVRAGASMDLEENEPGIRCVAAPIRDAGGSVVAAVSVSATRPFMPMQRMRALIPVMQKAARQVSQSLGYGGP